MAEKTKGVRGKDIYNPETGQTYEGSTERSQKNAAANFRSELIGTVGKQFDSKMGTQFERYNANIQQQAHVLTSVEAKGIGTLMNNNPDAYTYYRDGVPMSSSQIGIAGNITPIQFGPGGKGPNGTLVTEVTIGGEKYFAVPNDKSRTSGTILAHRNLARTFVNPNSPLGLKIHNQDIAVRTSVFNEFLRSNSNNGTHYSPVLPDPAGSKYGLQAVSSGSTKTGVGLFHIYAPDENGEYSPANRKTDVPLDIEAATILIDKLNK